MHSFRKYGQRKDFRRVVKMVTNGQSIARRGTIFECSGRDSRRRWQSNRQLRKPKLRLKQNSRRRRQSNMQLRKPRLRLKQKRNAYRRRQQSDRPLRTSSERRRRSASGRSL